MDLPFDNIGITNLVPDDVLEGEDVDVINADGFDSDPGNDEERNYRKRRLAELRTEMEGVINASGQWKYSFYTGQKFTTPKEAKNRVYLHSIESIRNLKLYKNDSVRIRARCEGKVLVFTMSQDAHDKGDLCPWILYVGKDKFTQNWVVKTHKDTHTSLQSREIKHCTYKFLSEKIFEQVRVNLDIPLRQFKTSSNMSWRDYVVELQSTNPNTTVKIAVERNIDHSLPTRVFQRIYCLGDDIDLHPNSNFTFISDRKKGIIPTIKTVYPSAEHRYCLRHIHENMKQGWCGQAYKDLLWRVASATNVRDFKKCRAKSNLLLNNICEVFNGKIVRGRDKPVITLLENIREYCMKRIVNVQGVIDKCTSPLTPTATRIMESIKKEAHLMKVQWNGANKKWELTGISYKHVVAACWNMALNDRAAPPPETWVNPCYWLSTWKETYSHKIQPICGTKYWEKSTCPTIVLPPKHHVQVGRPKKKRKRSKHEDEPFVKDGGNNAEGSGSASRQAQQTEPVVGQDGSGGSGTGTVIGLSDAVGEGGAGDPGGAGVDSQVSQTRNADGKEIGDGVPTQSSTTGGASEWSFLELVIPTPWSDESKNEERAKRYREEFEWKRSLFEIDLTFGINAFDLDKGNEVMKDKVSQKNVCEEEVPLNNNIGKQIGHFVDMPSEAVEQGMDATVPDEIDGAKGEQVPNHVVKKGNLEFLVFKEVANPGVNELVDKGKPLKRKRVYAE
ncbi:putative ribonuclease H-like domain-containing protein [Tanacetum coccineum]